MSQAISIAAKARGVTGFLKPQHQWEIVVTYGGKTDTRRTHNARDARRSYDMLVKYSREPIGKYSGASVTLTCDGETIAAHCPVLSDDEVASAILGPLKLTPE